MNRREALSATAVTLGALMAGSAVNLLSAAEAAAATGNWSAVADTAAKCVKSGTECAAHCEDLWRQGNKDMAECHAAVMDMIAACETLHKLAVRGSKHTPAFAKTCAAVCADCAKACEPHAKTMPICGTCATDCKDCEKACHKVG